MFAANNTMILIKWVGKAIVWINLKKQDQQIMQKFFDFVLFRKNHDQRPPRMRKVFNSLRKLQHQG